MLVTQNSHRDACDVVWPALPTKPGQKLFVKTDFFPDYVLTPIAYPHVLVTGVSDYSPSTFLTDEQIYEFLNRPTVTAWWSQNVCTEHPKLKHLPIGLEDTPEKLAFCEARGHELRSMPKRDAVYTNFTPDTNPHERNCFVTNVTSKVSFEEYMRTMATYRYVLCPMGNGVDTHRFWEAQVCGCTPIVRCPKEFLPTYENVSYISLPGFCFARFGHPNLVHRRESIFTQNSPTVSIDAVIQNNPLTRLDHFM